MGSFFYLRIYLLNMNKTQLRETILELFEEVKVDASKENVNEGLSSAMNGLVKFLLGLVKKGKFRRPYDIDDRSGRLVFRTAGGKKLVFHDQNIGVTIHKTWSGKKDSNFFGYDETDAILKFALEG
jgi:hypothetical protein